MDNNLKPITTLRPFTRLCMTIGALPTSYLVSMSYEEQLLWLCNYLEKTVIPTINNNGLAVEELQAKYVELKSYVENYFDNLDVQEEINNKLDEMALDGTLENLISQYIQLATTYVYNTVSDMKSATNLVNGSFARTSGYHSYNDNGGAFYKVRTITNEDVVDEASIIALNDNTLIAELIPGDYITPEQFGCYGDNTHDDTTNLLKALNYGKTIKGTKTYLIDFGGELYVTGSNTSKILLDGGTYNADGRLDFTNDVKIENCNINGNVHFYGKDFVGKNVIIKNNNFNVGELTFRLNNQDFESVFIENNYVRFYGAFWSSSQAESGNWSDGNVYIKNNEFYGKTVETQSESYYCACVVENQFVEFAGNYCHDYKISDTTQSVHDGYFSSKWVYHHDNLIRNFSGGSSTRTSLIMAKSLGTRYWSNDRYEMDDNTHQFPFIQIQDENENWYINNCNFKVKNMVDNDILESDNIFINNCNFEITNLYGAIMGKSYHMTNCTFNITNLISTAILSLNKGEIKNCIFNVTSVDQSLSSYGSIRGYSTSLDNLIDSCKSNIPLCDTRFYGTIRNSLINTPSTVILGQLDNCIASSRNIKFYDGESPTVYNYNISIISDGAIYGKSFSSTNAIDYTDADSKIRVKHDTANAQGQITIYDNPNDYSKTVPINLLRI